MEFVIETILMLAMQGVKALSHLHTFTHNHGAPMILVDKPYLSEYLKETILRNDYSVVHTPGADSLGLSGEPFLRDEEEAVATLRAAWDRQSNGHGGFKLYTTSENAIGWIGEHLGFTDLPQQIEKFKNKARFREMITGMHPEFFFSECPADALRELDLASVPFPIIVKPSVGFFSMGVHRVESADQWSATVDAIEAELAEVVGLYPQEVMDSTSFILEQCIEGDEFAVDAYFDGQGEPVILNILQHVFSSADDVSDRVYITGKEIIEANLESFTGYLREIGLRAGVTDFPVHMEVRRTASGEIVPIEINPMRFGGWCTTADLAAASYGFNPYEYYFSSMRPNWQEILQGKEGMLYSVVVLDNSTGVEGTRIKRFDYDAVRASFETVLDLRRVNWREYPVFGFLFTATRTANYAELERILASDLKQYISINA